MCGCILHQVNGKIRKKNYEETCLVTQDEKLSETDGLQHSNMYSNRTFMSHAE